MILIIEETQIRNSEQRNFTKSPGADENGIRAFCKDKKV